MNSQRHLLSVLVFLLSLMAFSCALAADGFVPALPSDTEGEVLVAGNYSNFEALEAAFDRFSEYYPDAYLSYRKLDGYNSVLGAALISEEKPTICHTYLWMRNNPNYQDLFLSMENLADPALGLDFSLIRDEMLTFEEDGSLFMLPIFSTTYGVLVNEAIFEKEGLSYPATYAELLDACAKLKAAGYPSPIMGCPVSGQMSLPLCYPILCAALSEHPDQVALLNSMDPAGAQILKPLAEQLRELMDLGCIDLEACQSIPDDYNGLILRFFEGDVPMMVASGDTVSGTRKRESQSQAFMEHPFPYTFRPVPFTEEGGYFLNCTSIEFSVNKNSEDLTLTNEFIRFLLSPGELDQMAKDKRLVTVTKDMSLDGIYSAFEQVAPGHSLNEQQIGLNDPAIIQMRLMLDDIMKGEKTVQEALDAYGTYVKQ